jgi:hypothetical protein
MSMGISTLTGPVGAVIAACTAALSVDRQVSALSTRKAALETAFSIVNWSGASWMYESFLSRYWVSIWPVMCKSGVPAV